MNSSIMIGFLLLMTLTGEAFSKPNDKNKSNISREEEIQERRIRMLTPEFCKKKWEDVKIKYENKNRDRKICGNELSINELSPHQTISQTLICSHKKNIYNYKNLDLSTTLGKNKNFKIFVAYYDHKPGENSIGAFYPIFYYREKLNRLSFISLSGDEEGNLDNCSREFSGDTDAYYNFEPEIFFKKNKGHEYAVSEHYLSDIFPEANIFYKELVPKEILSELEKDFPEMVKIVKNTAVSSVKKVDAHIISVTVNNEINKNFDHHIFYFIKKDGKFKRYLVAKHSSDKTEIYTMANGLPLVNKNSLRDKCLFFKCEFDDKKLSNDFIYVKVNKYIVGKTTPLEALFYRLNKKTDSFEFISTAKAKDPDKFDY